MEAAAGEGTGRCRMAPPLLHLCMRQTARLLLDLTDKLHLMPLELAEVFWKDYLGRGDNPRLLELEVMAEAFWSPTRICLTGVNGLNSRGLYYLSFASNLSKLDLSGCSWVDSLNFLPELKQLQCLCLRDCWRLGGESLSCIQRLPKLRCLDLENVYSISDSVAAQFIQGMSSLYALNVSGTGVADIFVAALTYGCQLQSWDTSRTSCATGLTMAGRSISQGSSSINTAGSDSYENLHQQWPPLQIKYLRLQRTMVSQEAIQLLLALKDIILLDVRRVNVTKRSLDPFQAKYGLVALPNDFKLLARSNSLLVATLRHSCGCLAAADTEDSQHSLSRGRVDWIAQFEKRGLVQLLKEASRVHSRRYLV